MPTRTCSICGDAAAPEGRWFLVVQNLWEDKLKILEWNDRLATNEDVHQACSIEHVRELVVHWMTTGSLDYPFAQLRLLGREAPLRSASHGIRDWEVSARPLGELAVHRESMQRVLSENPHSLKTILDSLLAALRRDASEPVPDQELENGELKAIPWEI